MVAWVLAQDGELSAAVYRRQPRQQNGSEGAEKKHIDPHQGAATGHTKRQSGYRGHRHQRPDAL